MASNTHQTVLLWDIIDWSIYCERVGEDESLLFTDKIKAIAKQFYEEYDGTCISDGGDAHFVMFDSANDALHAACSFVQYMKLYSGLVPDAKIRIVLTNGVLTLNANGIYQGKPLTRASRLEKLATAFEFIIDEQVKSQLILSSPTFQQYLLEHSKTLKGIRKTRFCKLDWAAYCYAKPEKTLHNYISKIFRNSELAISSTTFRPLERGVIYWPVVPRAELTAILRAQIEVLKVFSLLGWHIIILITDYATESQDIESLVEKFKNHVNNYFVRRKFTPSIEIKRLSSYISRPSDICCSTMQQVEKLMNTTKYGTLVAYNTKNYPKKQVEKLLGKPISRHMRPLYTIAVLSQLIKANETTNTLVLSGRDETPYWGEIETSSGAPQQHITIPTLNETPKSQLFQTDTRPIWGSPSVFEHDLLLSLNKRNLNLHKWVFELFIILPSLIVDDYNISTRHLTSLDITTEQAVKELSSFTYPLLEINTAV